MSRIITLNPTDPDYQLAPHFNSREFRCHHCGALVVDLRLPAACERLRKEVSDILGRDTPLRLTCGHRCKIHNAAIGGVRWSGHIRGTAADIVTPRRMNTRIFAGIAWDIREAAGIARVGCYGGYHGKFGFIHVEISKLFPWYKSTWGDSFIV